MTVEILPARTLLNVDISNQMGSEVSPVRKTMAIDLWRD